MKDRIRQFLHYNIWILILDILAFVLSYLFAAYIRFFNDGEMQLAQDYLVFFWHYIPYYALCSLVVFGVFRLIGNDKGIVIGLAQFGNGAVL